MQNSLEVTCLVQQTQQQTPALVRKQLRTFAEHRFQPDTVLPLGYLLAKIRYSACKRTRH